MKTKHFTIPAILLAVIMTACNSSAQKSSNESNNSDTLVQSESPKEEPVAPKINYNDFPVAYVKNSVLYFFNPENEATVQFTEETDSVFNCVYSDKDAMFYYSVSRNGMLSFKKVDLSATPVQPQSIIDLNKPAEKFFTETYGSKAKLYFLKNNLFLESDFYWEMYGFSKIIDYSLDNNEISIIDRGDYYDKYLQYEEEPCEDSGSRNRVVFNKAKQMDLSKYMVEPDFEVYCEPMSFSANCNKMAFAVITGFGDLPHGPYCIANTDGTMMQLLDGTDIGSDYSPIWSNNNAVFERTKEISEDESVYEFCYTRATDNTPVLIDQDVDYFAVRKKHPIN